MTDENFEKGQENTEIKYTTLFDNSLEGICISKGERIITANKALLKALHYDNLKDFTSKKISEHIDHASRKKFAKFLAEIYSGEEVQTTFEINVYRKSGEVRVVIVSSGVIILNDEKYIQSTFRDVTDSKKAEKLLIERERLYRNVVEKSSDGIAIIQNSKFIYVNPALINICGYSEKELIGKKFSNFVHDDYKEKFILAYKNRKSHYRDVIDKKYKTPFFEAVFVSKSGKNIYGETNVSETTYQGKKVDLVVVRDITQRKKDEEEKRILEKSFYQAQKMESIGRLAGGIAHDFGNILTIIMGYADILRTKFKDKKSYEGKAANSIFENSMRSKALVEQLMKFARQDELEIAPLDVNNLIKEVSKLTRSALRSNVKISFDLEKNINFINGDWNRLDQVITNLLINANDAMPDGGTINFRTENVEISGNDSDLKFKLSPGNYIKLIVSDTGNGIPEDKLDKIFEPFFTTKKSGKGTGLGLATVYGIINNHNGHIAVSSKVGKGTSFYIYLPDLKN